jgi:hypothetical protein
MTDLRERGCEKRWMELLQVCVQWQGLVSNVEPLVSAIILLVNFSNYSIQHKHSQHIKYWMKILVLDIKIL